MENLSSFLRGESLGTGVEALAVKFAEKSAQSCLSPVFLIQRPPVKYSNVVGPEAHTTHCTTYSTPSDHSSYQPPYLSTHLIAPYSDSVSHINNVSGHLRRCLPTLSQWEIFAISPHPRMIPELCFADTALQPIDRYVEACFLRSTGLLSYDPAAISELQSSEGVWMLVTLVEHCSANTFVWSRI